MANQYIGSSSENSTRYVFNLVEWDLSPIRKVVLISSIFVPVFHLQTCFHRFYNITAYGVHRLINFSSSVKETTFTTMKTIPVNMAD